VITRSVTIWSAISTRSAAARLRVTPWTIRRTFMLREGVRVREYVCAENNLDPGRYQEYLKNPSLFVRSPEQAAPPR
jgi:hypothetical protein